MSTKNMMTAVGAVGLLVSVAVLPSRAAENRRNVPPQQQQPQPQQRLGRIEKADEVIGSQIKNSQGQTFSKIDQVVVDLESGRVLFAVASVDGNEVAVAPGSFSMGTGARTFTLEGDKQKLAGAPQVNKDQATADLANAEFVTKVYQYWNQQPWWQGAAQPTGRTAFGNVHKASELKGVQVKNVANQDVGKVDNVMIDLLDARVPYVLISSGGSPLGGGQIHAVPPNAFTPGPDRKTLVTALDRQKLEGAPRIPKNNLQALSDPAFAASIYHYYGKQPYCDTNAISPTGRPAGRG